MESSSCLFLTVQLELNRSVISHLNLVWQWKPMLYHNCEEKSSFYYIGTPHHILILSPLPFLNPLVIIMQYSNIIPSNVVVEWLSLPLHIWKVPWFKSQPRDWVSWSRFLVVFLRPSRWMSRYYLKIRPWSLPSTSFPIHLASSHLTLYSRVTERA
jgi:hypothetical protein